MQQESLDVLSMKFVHSKRNAFTMLVFTLPKPPPDLEDP